MKASSYLEGASKNKIIFWNFCYCCKNPNLDRNLNLCAGRYHEKEIEARTEPLHNFTDFELDSF
jgi:hypothetical protein